MTTEIRSLAFQRAIQAPVAQVYRAFTNAQWLRQWFCEIATVAPRVGGRFYAAWHSGNALFGHYTALIPNEQIALTLRGYADTDRSQVTITLKAQGVQTELTLVEASDGAAWQNISQAIEQGWHEHLDNLKAMLEAGIDLRDVNRPMLGIGLGEQKPGVGGVFISGVLEGMDAQKAGLQKGDVILRVAGQATPDEQVLLSVLRAHRAGETLEVIFDRNGQHETRAIQLSPRPVPEMPKTPAALAELIGQAYAAINTALTGLLAGIDETHTTQAAADTWNIQQILAHLIAAERDLHSKFMAIASGQEPWQDDWEGNPPVRVDAIVKVYGTTQALLTEFIRNEAETIAILAGLPDEFVAQKRSFRRIAASIKDWPDHTREHVAEIEALLQR